ncbi:PLP-dependent aminotransferase family protein [Aneurinibacillus thermoaerophilus]|uniref:aminotransferase-like domain-containing protein n=1 Tax=Aneurinibacillus thermoaerophilus TaxID=143495 RepID=UPI002E220976
MKANRSRPIVCRSEKKKEKSMMKNVEWKPDGQSGVPLYKQIIHYIRGKIARGEWPIGYKIPPERTLAEQFGVNRSTVTNAFAELAAEGLIEGKRGSGTRVINNTWTLLAASAPPDWRAYVEAGAHRPNLSMIQRINEAEFVPGTIRLGTGEMSPDMFPSEMMALVLERTARVMRPLGYEEPLGLYELREAVSQHVRLFGIQASPSAILIVSGALQALHFISIGLLPRGSAILLEKPSYLCSVRVFQSAGIRLAGIPEIKKPEMIPARLSHYKHKHKAALLYTIPSFHNPTGKVMSEEARQQLMLSCEHERLPIIEDDVYGELWLDEKPPASLKARDKNGLVLYIGSLSKTLSPGLRIGWIIGPEPVIRRLADIKMQTDYGSSSLSQWVAKEWLTSGLYGEHLTRIREQLRTRREMALTVLEKYMKGLADWEAPAGGFYVWLRLLIAPPLQKLFESALRQGVLLNPGNIYDPGERERLRISYAYASPAEFEEGVRRLARLLIEAGRRKQ